MPSIETLTYKITKHIELLNLNNINKKHTSLICPICLNKFDTNNHEESLEHVPQKSLGGKVIAITCKSCNNTCGTKIDGQLTKYIKTLENNEFIEGSEKYVSVYTPDGQINGKLIIENSNSYTLKLDKTQNNPKTFDIRRGNIKRDSLIEVQSKSPKVEISGLNAALLKNAYMILFSKFGYTFLLDVYYNKFREQIIKPNEKIIPEGLWTIQNKLKINDGIYLSDYNLYRGLFVVFTLKKLKEHKFMYFIPTPLMDVDIAAYHLRHIQKGDPIRLRSLGEIDYLLSINYVAWIKQWISNW